MARAWSRWEVRQVVLVGSFWVDLEGERAKVLVGTTSYDSIFRDFLFSRGEVWSVIGTLQSNTLSSWSFSVDEVLLVRHLVLANTDWLFHIGAKILLMVVLALWIWR